MEWDYQLSFTEITSDTFSIRHYRSMNGLLHSKPAHLGHGCWQSTHVQ